MNMFVISWKLWWYALEHPERSQAAHYISTLHRNYINPDASRYVRYVHNGLWEYCRWPDSLLGPIDESRIFSQNHEPNHEFTNGIRYSRALPVHVFSLRVPSVRFCTMWRYGEQPDFFLDAPEHILRIFTKSRKFHEIPNSWTESGTSEWLREYQYKSWRFSIRSIRS